MPRIESPEELVKVRAEILSKRDPNKPCISICAGSGCIASGAGKVIEAFKKEIEAQGLTAEVDTKGTGCPGFCQRGPVVVIYPEEICYLDVKPEDVPEIVSQNHQRKSCRTAPYEDPSTGEKATLESRFPSINTRNESTSVLISRLTPRA